MRRLDRLSQWSIRRPRAALAILCGAVLLAAPGLLRLRVRTDGRALVPSGDPAVRFDAEVRERFALRDPIVVLVETSHPDGVYNAATLRHLARLTGALAGLDAIGWDNVMSLATEHRDRVFPGTLRFRSFLDPIPDTPALVAQLRSDVAAAGILTGTLVSADGKAAAIFVGVPAAPPGAALALDRAALYRRIARLVEVHRDPSDRVIVAGAPVAETLLGIHILEDLKLLVPATIAVITLVFWRGCRRLWGTVTVLVKVAATLLWTFGVMGWLGAPVYLTTAVLPVILVSICLADEIHIFMQYQRYLAEPGGGGEPPAAVRATMRLLALPITLACLVTAIGFFSFLASALAPVRAFGLFAGVGVLFELLWSLTAVPATLALLGPARMRRPTPFAPAGAGVFRRIAAPLLRHRRASLAFLALVTVSLAWGTRRLYVQDSWVDGFALGSPFRRATEEVNRQLLGTHVLLAHLRFSPPPERIPEAGSRRGPLLAPEALESIGAFESFARARPQVGGVLGPYSQLTAVSYLFLARREGARSIPATPRRVARLLEVFELARGERRRRELIDDGLERAVVSIYLKDANYRDTAALMGALRGYERARLLPRGTHLAFAGDVAVSQAMIPAIVDTQVASTALALLGSCLVLCLLFRSLWLGICALLPSAVAVVWVLGAMGWGGIPLGVATSMFCAITLGVGEDYAIHFLYRIRQARQAGRPDPVLAAFEVAGPAIVSDTLAISLGFAVLLASSVPANARLGLVMAVALLACCTLTLAGLGPALSFGTAGGPVEG
ncbi:MAG TPA: MMPL family transporter [Thermoanaerobaculia bacterium]|nr:MMPL family transporter [Thermoanaerobaculia bacterium]